MARIPQYINKDRVSTGSTFARSERGPGGVGAEGQALARLGAQITGFGADVFEATDGFDKVAEKQAEKDYQLRQTDKLIDFRQDLERELLARQEGAVDGAQGFGTGYETFVNERTQSYIKQHFPGRENDAELAVRFKQTSDGFLSSAAKFEVGRRIEWRGGVMNKQLDALGTGMAGEVAGALAAGDADGASEALAGTYQRAEAEFGRTVEAQFGDNPRSAAIAMGMGREKLQKAWLAAYAAADPKGYIDKFDGAFAGTPRKQIDPNFKIVHDSATAAGISHETMGAILFLESKNGAIDAPIGKDGVPMSSAVGPWQILKGTAYEIGIHPDDRRDWRIATPAIARHLKDNQEDLRKNGLPVNDATTYMTWNVGPAATKALLRASPDADVETVLRRVWASKGPAWIDTALRNNPSMYRPGMTVGQVLTNYQSQVERGKKANADKWAGTEVDSTTRVRDAIKEFTPFDPTGIDAASASEIYREALTTWKTQAKDILSTATVEAFAKGVIPTHGITDDMRKDIDKVITVDPQGVVSGDTRVHGSLIDLADRGHIPESGARALSDAIIQPGRNTGKIASLLTSARIAQEFPHVWREAKVQGDVRDRVDMFTAMVDAERIPADVAVQIVDTAFSPEGKSARAAMGDRIRMELRNNKKGEVEGQKVTWGEVEKFFDGKYGTSMLSDTQASDFQKDMAVKTYERLYEHNRLQGHEPEHSKSIALLQMDKTWGVTNVDGTSRLTPAPVERTYPAIGGDHKWIMDQAANHVRSALYDRGILRVSEGVDVIPEFRVVPTAETMDDIRMGRKSPRYAVLYRRQDGAMEGVMDVASSSVQFDARDAEIAFKEKFISDAAQGRAPKTSPTKPLDTLYSP